MEGAGLEGAFTESSVPFPGVVYRPWPAIGCSPTPAPPQQEWGNDHELR